MRFKCWNHDCESEEDGKDINSGSHRLAAEVWAEQHGHRDGDYSDEYEVTVLDERRRFWAVTVKVDMMPRFNGDQPVEVEEDGCTFKRKEEP